MHHKRLNIVTREMDGRNEVVISELMPFPLDDRAENLKCFSAKATCLLMPYDLLEQAPSNNESRIYSTCALQICHIFSSFEFSSSSSLIKTTLFTLQ